MYNSDFDESLGLYVKQYFASYDDFDDDLRTKINSMNPSDFFLQILTRSLELTNYEMIKASVFIESLIFGSYFNTEDLPKLSTLEIGILESLFGLASFHHKMAKNDANFHYYNLKQDMEKLRNHYKNAG